MPLLDLESVQPSYFTPTARKPLYEEEGAPPPTPADAAPAGTDTFADVAAIPYNVARSIGQEAKSLYTGLPAAKDTPEAQSLDRAFDTIGAAFRVDNNIASGVANIWRQNGPNNNPQPGYNAFNDIKGTPYEAQWDLFVDSNNAEQTQRIKSGLDSQEADRKTLAAAGWGGTVASLGAGMLDPMWFIPVGGEIAKGGEMAYRVGFRAAHGLKAGLVGGAAAEAGLHATQDGRDWGESAMTIGSSALLGGLLGGSFAAMSRSEVEKASRALANLTHPTADVPWGPKSIGAAESPRLTTGDLTVAGKMARGAADAFKFSPNLRGNFRASPLARQYTQELGENTLYQNMHAEGRSVGPAVETLARSTYNSRIFDAMSKHEEIYKEYKRANGSSVDWTGADRQSFEEQVGEAMRNGDSSDNPFVQKAAESWRQRIFEPFKNEAIEHGLLPEGVDVSTAASYFTRLWNKEMLTAHEPDFKATVADHYNGVMKESFRNDTARLADRHSALDQEAADLSIPADQRQKVLDDLEAQGETLDEANQQHVQTASDINEARARARLAEDAGDKTGAKAARDEARRLAEAGGQGYKDYTKQRSALRSRYKRVDLNYAGISERVDKTIQQIADIEEANRRSVNRVAQRGQKFERDLTKLDPEKVETKRTELRDAFTELADKADKSAEKLTAQLEKMDADAKLDPVAKDARSRTLIERAQKAEAERAQRLSSIAERLEVAESLDPQGRIAELRAALNDLVSETSGKGLSRGERVGRLKEKLDRLDPKALDLRAKAIAEVKKRISRDYYDKWEVKHLGKNLDAPAKVDGFANETASRDTSVKGATPNEIKRANKVFDAVKSGDLAPEARLTPEGYNWPHTVQQRMLDAVKEKLPEGYSAHPTLDDAFEHLPAHRNIHITDRAGNLVRVVTNEAQAASLTKKGIAAERPIDTVAQEAGSRAQPVANENAKTKEPDFTDAAKQIADDVFDKLTGRAQTDSSSVLPEYLTPITRGPLKDRTFNIPDAKVTKYLESNVNTVAERYGRTMAAEIELTRRFGRADMRDQIQQIRDEYRDLREKAGADEKLLKQLRDDEKGALEDLAAMRDLIRGTYKATENASNYGRVVRSLMAFNYIRSMGGVLIPNLSEIYRPAFVHGMGAWMNQGVKPLLTNRAAFKASVKELQQLGQVVERVTQQRMMSLGEIGDPYRHGTAIERVLQNATRVGSKWNGLVFWTDFGKAVGGILSQNRVLAGVMGEGDARFLAYLGVDKNMAPRIAEQFKTHGETMDTIHVANTQHWTDPDAVRAYRGAVSKDVDSIIVTKSVGDVPLFANTPTGKLLLQFRNYTFAAHQRVLLRGLQENKTRFISGMIAMTSMGMLGTYARAWRGGASRFEEFKKAAENPGYWIGEGLDAAGIFTLPIEASNDIEKWTGAAGVGSFNPIKTPLKAAFPGAPQGGRSVRTANQDWLSPILGPSESLGADALRGAGALGLGAQSGLTGQGGPTKGQKNAALRMIPFSSYLGVREMLQGLAGDSPYGN